MQLLRHYDTLAADLSGGQMKLLEIARALMGEPKLLLLDEPTAGVAPKLAYEIFQQIARLRDDYGITFLIVEHRLEILFDFVDTVMPCTWAIYWRKARPPISPRTPRCARCILENRDLATEAQRHREMTDGRQRSVARSTFRQTICRRLPIDRPPITNRYVSMGETVARPHSTRRPQGRPIGSPLRTLIDLGLV